MRIIATFALPAAIAVGVVSSAIADASPYGVCSHLTRAGFADRDDSCRWISAAGIGWVRCDFDWGGCQKEKGGPISFAHTDAVMESAERKGLQVLPIVQSPPKWALPLHEHTDDAAQFVEALVRHYGDRIPALETWNEPNLAPYWKDTNPTNFFAYLKAVYVAAKRANPKVKVLFPGVNGVPFSYIEAIYALGGAKYFDAMCIHPYCYPLPRPPEGELDGKLERLRAMMAKYGDGDKPIIITEQGWPATKFKIDGNGLRTGLALARPEKKSWNVVYAATGPVAQGLSLGELESAIERAMPPGSKVEACLGGRLKKRLAAGDVDAVIYPFDEQAFPLDTFEEVFDFVRKGGTLVSLGGMALWHGTRDSGAVDRRDVDEARRRLRIDTTAHWLDKKLPKEGRAFPTAAALVAGFPKDRRVFVKCYQTPRLLQSGDEWIPYLTLKDKEGNEVVAASVIRFNSDLKGRVVVSGAKNVLDNFIPGVSDDCQARYLVRGLAISLAEGVEAYYWYEFRDDRVGEGSPYGLVHGRFAPRPAFGAYMNFIQQRPVGSVRSAAKWHDAGRQFYFPQWTRPDGTKAGLLWRKKGHEKRLLKFDADGIQFVDYTGFRVNARRVAPRTYEVFVDESPLFFSGGALLVGERVE